MIELVDRLLMNMDNGLLIGLSLIDFHKSFDLVHHTIRGVDTVVQVLSRRATAESFHQ